MEIHLILYKDEKEIAVSLIRTFWKVHNDYDQTTEEAMKDLKAWTCEGHLFYLIQYAHQYVGFVHMGSRGCSIDWLEDLFVTPEFQGRGIGSRAIELMESEVRKYSDSMYIEAAARNERAIRLYRRLGYDCLNTITVRKDLGNLKFEVIRSEKIYDQNFEIKRIKRND